VAALDILESTAVETMTAGEFDLTLFTCTYDGKSRVTVYCNKE
jgi:sortase A